MKRYFLAILIISFSAVCIAQDSTQVSIPSIKHLIFKGMPINGHIDDFVELFINDGFSLSENNVANSVALNGNFAGQKAGILISATIISKTVYQVCVMFEKIPSFWSAKSKFNEFVESYTKKYGIPTRSLRSFNSPYYEGDGYEDSAMRLGKVNYASIWTLDEGSIIVTIMNTGATAIMYRDAVNEKLENAERQEYVNSDI